MDSLPISNKLDYSFPIVSIDYVKLVIIKKYALSV
jgi:hypothetical protein